MNNTAIKPTSAKQKGVTLIELMIAVLIIGILSAIALPAYNNHVTESRRADAATLIMAVASQQEQYFIENKTYSTDLSDLGFAASSIDSENDYYLIQMQAASVACPVATCYVIEAVPQGAQAGDTSCGTLTLSSLGTKLPAGCW